MTDWIAESAHALDEAYEKAFTFGLDPVDIVATARRERVKHATEVAQADPNLAKRVRRYGLTVQDYVGLLQAQGGRCAVCLSDVLDKPLNVDHDHSMKLPNADAVRGLLCTACNTAFGQLRLDGHLIGPTLSRVLAYFDAYAARLGTEAAQYYGEVADAIGRYKQASDITEVVLEHIMAEAEAARKATDAYIKADMERLPRSVRRKVERIKARNARRTSR